MPNQRDIAKKLGTTQATVSMALREDPSISKEMRERVRQTADEMGYQQNAYVKVLMSQVRSGRKISDKGVIGLLVATRSLADWHEVTSYRIFHQGVVQRGKELGFRVEPFFIQQKDMTPARLDRILQARGITGIILAPPYHGNRSLQMDWRAYSAVGVGYGWEAQELNRVVYDNLQNFITAFNELRKLGYKRIGTVLGETFTYGNRYGTKWYTGFLECQNALPKKQRIPVFAGQNQPGENQVPVFAGASDQNPLEPFRIWFEKWKPDALLTLTGKEIQWLERLGLNVPADVGMACLSQPSEDHFARIEEKGDIVGATALEMVAAQMGRNELGPPVHPKVTMIEGRWVSGRTTKAQKSVTGGEPKANS